MPPCVRYIRKYILYRIIYLFKEIVFCVLYTYVIAKDVYVYANGVEKKIWNIPSKKWKGKKKGNLPVSKIF